jgi:IS30 family transposase
VFVNSENQERGYEMYITEQERYKIEGFKAIKLSNRAIARALAKSHTAINDEIKRGTVKQLKTDLTEVSVYKADYAQMRADEAGANKGTGLKIGNDHKLAAFLEAKIRDDRYSPDAALAAARKQGGFKNMICTKTLYNYIDANLFLGISNKDLLIKKHGKKRDYKPVRKVALNNVKGTSIEKRSESANNREEAGHWEIDIVIGKKGANPVIMTLVERKSRKSLYVLLKNKTQKEVIAALKRLNKRVGGDFFQIFKSITADNGTEFLDFTSMKEAASCDEIYYAHPYSSWERGSNENGNRILRRFIPKGTDLNGLNDDVLQRYEDWVNNYPRRILNYQSANEAYADVI